VIAHCVTLATAKGHLRILTPEGHVDDPVVQLKLDGAEAAILTYVGKETRGAALVAEWIDPAATPADVVAAILWQLGELCRFRGDDPGSPVYSPGRDPNTDLSPVVIGLLRRYATPVIGTPVPEVTTP
jgi:hypothetical protein